MMHLSAGNMDNVGGDLEELGAAMTYYGERDAHPEPEMINRTSTERLVELADRAERLTQELAELRRRIDVRPKRRPSSGDLPVCVPPKPEVSSDSDQPVTVRMPARSLTPSSAETLMWLPAVKPPSLSRLLLDASQASPEPLRLEPPISRSPGSGVRRIAPDAGRYSIIAADRGKRRANG